MKKQAVAVKPVVKVNKHADVKAFVRMGQKLGQPVSNANAVKLFMAAK